MTHYPNTQQLEALPVLAESQADDLHIDTGDYRVWLSRTGTLDGEPYDNIVTIEDNGHEGWQTMHVYDGDNPPTTLPGLTTYALQGEY